MVTIIVLQIQFRNVVKIGESHQKREVITVHRTRSQQAQCQAFSLVLSFQILTAASRGCYNYSRFAGKRLKVRAMALNWGTVLPRECLTVSGGIFHWHD